MTILTNEMLDIMGASAKCHEELTRAGLSVNCTSVKCDNCIIRKGLEALEQRVINEEKTCSLCGHKGTDVSSHFEYVGGQGFTNTPPSCNDIIACWSRWDKQHGLKHTPAINEMNQRILNSGAES